MNKYRWKQLSQWDSTPNNCIIKYISRKGHYLRYILVSSIISEDGKFWVDEIVESIENISDDILHWINTDYTIINNRN